ncbi:hypothetical protein Fmac_024210 [Flemingia macrophylla]|uniref:C2 NT-type domain-containing protein n=1 Tax=Flemingia macrophylla TaxID=520843 RepID=A0ABD1LNQ5_9FABA
MVLGLRSKSRKSVSIQVQFIIHVQEIKPWPPSQSLTSVQSVILQWENGDQISGSLASTAGTGKIEFNESFRLSVTMWKEVSKKSKHRESFQKNCLEFYLYDKSVKSHLLGSATINFADFGIIKETKALNILLNCKKSSKSSSQPFLYVSIQPFDTECSSSSPSSSLSKELSLDKEGSETVSQSQKDDEDLDIDSFTDDDCDDIPSNAFQTIRSISKNTGDSTKISERGAEGSRGEFTHTTSSPLGNIEGEASTQFNDIKTPSSPTVLRSDRGNAANGRPSLPESSEKTFKLADASSEIQESIQQSSASYISSSMKQNSKRSFQSQVTREDGTIDHGFNTDALEKVSSVSNTEVMEDREKMKERRKAPEQVTIRNELLENELVNNYSDDDSTKKGKFNSATFLPKKKSHEHETSILMNDKTEDMTNVKFPTQFAENYKERMEERRKEPEQFTKRNEPLENELANNYSDDDSTKKGELDNATLLPHKKSHQHETSSLMNDKTEDMTNVKFPPQSAENYKERMEERRKEPEQFTMRNELLENELGNNYFDDDSTKKGELDNATLLPHKKSHQHETSSLMNDKTEDMTNVKFPPQSAENYRERMEERRKEPEQFTMRNELLENELANSYSDDGSTKKGELDNATLLPHKKSNEHETSSLMNDKTEDVTNVKFPLQSALNKVSSVSNTEVMEEKRKGQKQFTMTNELLENELVNDYSDDDSTKKEELDNATLLPNKKSHEHETSILMNDQTVDMTNIKFPLQPAENYGLFNSNQTHDQAEEIKTMNDVHVDTACHEDNNVNGSCLNNTTELKAEIERLREELREAAALEISMYSVIAEHSSSSNKVHAPARRLSRFYFHACRVGSPATIGSAAQSVVSGFVLVSKACGNDVPRLIFWFSNIISLRAILSKRVGNIHIGGPCINSECDVTGNSLHEEEKDNTDSWEDPKTILVALEKVEAWIFSRIVESVWWQTLTPYMQSAATKSSSCMKAYEKRYRVGDQDQGSFSIDLWKRAFKDACDRLCPLRAGGHECGCLPVIARLVMEQLVSRLDVAMFNAILRESAEEMPMDPISDPISDSKVLPIPAGKSGLGAGAQLKNAIGDWSRWLSDLFSIDDSSESLEVSNEDDEPKFESSFKPFHLLNALSDLMMLPLDMLADGSTRKEVCPKFGVSLIKRVVNNFVPDEFSPGPIPDAVYDTLNEDIEDDEGCITSLPCSAGSTFYAPPPPSSVVGMLQEVKTKTSIRSGSFVLQKLYTSDDELDELDAPLSALGVDDSSLSSREKFSPVKWGRKVVRYELLREAWKTSE